MKAGQIFLGGLALVASLLAVAGTTGYFMDRIAEAERSGLEAQLNGNTVRYETQLAILQSKLQDQEVLWAKLKGSCDEVTSLLGSRLVERRKDMEARLADAHRINKEAIEALRAIPGGEMSADSVAAAFEQYESDMLEAIASYEGWHKESKNGFQVVEASVTGASEPVRKHLDAVLHEIENKGKPIEASHGKELTKKKPVRGRNRMEVDLDNL